MSAQSIVDLVLVGLFTIVAILVVLTVWFVRTTKPLPAALEGLDALPPPRRRRRGARATTAVKVPTAPASPASEPAPEPDSASEPAQ